MSRSAHDIVKSSKVWTVTEEPHLHYIVDGNFDEPEDRIGRKGVPEHKLRYREPRSGKDVWRDTRDAILERSHMRMKSQIFSYKTLPLSEDLNQIRLLVVQPAKRITDPVVCELFVKDLAAVKNKFEALSYCWGIEEPDSMISIRPVRPTQVDTQIDSTAPVDFPVRRNLLWALRHLRRRNRAILLWVDAICINQRDMGMAKAEKDQQLSMMSEIYNSAKNVCVWIGETDTQAKATFDFVKLITNFQMVEKRLRPSAEDPHIGRQWYGLVKTLKETQWFSRRWIIQEIASARNASVHCGDDVVHWDDLAVVISLLQENCSTLERHFGDTSLDLEFGGPLLSEIPSLSATQLVKALNKVCRKSTVGEISEKLLDFETLVCTFQQFQARFPQDIVHSVRALAKDAPGRNDESLSVDNKKSTRDLFIAFVERCIRRSGSLDIICRHWAQPITDTADEQIRLPSWISELSNGPFGLPGNSFERQNGENFVAISPGYNWKRYNASNRWQARAPKIPPINPLSKIDGASSSIRWSTGNYPEASYTESITDSPTGDTFPFQHDVSNDTEGGAQACEVAVHNTNGVAPRLSPHSPHLRRGVENLPPLLRESNQFSLYHSKRAGFTSGLSNPSLHRRAVTLTHLPTVPEAVDGWKLIANAAISRKRLGAQLQAYEGAHSREGTQDTAQSQTSSQAKRSSYAQQEDEEHQKTSSGHLEVYGFRLGDVKNCSDVMRNGIVPGNWLEKLGWRNDSANNLVPEEIWRMLVADRTASGGDPPEWYKRACLHCLKDTRLINSNGDLNTFKSLPDIDNMTLTYLKRVQSVIWRRRIIELKLNDSRGDNVLFGLAPEKTSKGDIVCILAGCSVPVVMRAVTSPEGPASDESEGVYEVVGEAYVHKMMDGEAVRDIAAADKMGKKFTLE